MSNSVWSAVRRAYASGVLDMGYPFARNVRYVGENAPTGVTAYNTIQEAVDALIDGDLLIVGPGEYDENVTITDKNKITVIGAGNPHACRLTALTNGIALTIVGGQDVTIINMNLEGRGTGGALKLDGQIRRLVVQGCKIHGGADGVLIAPAALGQIVEAIIEGCLITGLTTGISHAGTGGDPTHKVTIQGNRFIAITTDCIVSTGSFINGMVIDNIMGNDGDTEPTRFIKLDGAGDSGIVAGNQFATPTNDNAKFVLDADVMWGANATEAGWSTARPS